MACSSMQTQLLKPEPSNMADIEDIEILWEDVLSVYEIEIN
jgi:hypothetical protein